jgi:hypothetical protein
VAQESYFTYSENEESIVDHDVHFRPGLGTDGSETFTPRTVIYDLKGGFGALRKFNALYDIQDDSAPVQGLWYGRPLRYVDLLDEMLSKRTGTERHRHSKSNPFRSQNTRDIWTSVSPRHRSGTLM